VKTVRIAVSKSQAVEFLKKRKYEEVLEFLLSELRAVKRQIVKVRKKHVAQQLRKGVDTCEHCGKDFKEKALWKTNQAKS
jgi:lysyl-tRNA synthetase class I